MENIPHDIIVVILDFFKDSHSVEPILNLALVSKDFFYATKGILQKRVLINKFATATFPLIFYHRAMCMMGLSAFRQGKILDSSNFLRDECKEMVNSKKHLRENLYQNFY